MITGKCKQLTIVISQQFTKFQQPSTTTTHLVALDTVIHLLPFWFVCLFVCFFIVQQVQSAFTLYIIKFETYIHNFVEIGSVQNWAWWFNHQSHKKTTIGSLGQRDMHDIANLANTDAFSCTILIIHTKYFPAATLKFLYAQHIWKTSQGSADQTIVIQWVLYTWFDTVAMAMITTAAIANGCWHLSQVSSLHKVTGHSHWCLHIGVMCWHQVAICWHHVAMHWHHVANCRYQSLHQIRLVMFFFLFVQFFCLCCYPSLERHTWSPKNNKLKKK